ncbi:MAG TPA: hypothetical protein VD902_05015 [Symbiobacteriaceae bacterium]|nr:hypothetical protein [Symbiobacteriaceae bacterium]
MRSLLRELQAGSGVTTLLVTHDHDEALQLADRLGVLLDGRVAQAGPPAEVLARPASRAVAAFMQAGTLVPGHASDGSFTCALGTGSMPNRAKPWPDGPAWVVIPPSALQVTAPGQGTPAEVASIRLTRRGPELEVRAGGHLLTVWSAAALAPGQAIGLAWDPQSSWFVYD